MVSHSELFYLEVYFCCYRRAGTKKLGISMTLRNCYPLSVIDLSEQLEVLSLTGGLLKYTKKIYFVGVVLNQSPDTRKPCLVAMWL